MSHRSTPTSSVQANGYASPSAYSRSHSYSHSHSSTPVPGTPTTPTAGGSGAKPSGSSGQQAAKPKPTNVFSNDGSFLERFQRIQKVCPFSIKLTETMLIDSRDAFCSRRRMKKRRRSRMRRWRSAFILSVCCCVCVRVCAEC